VLGLGLEDGRIVTFLHGNAGRKCVNAQGYPSRLSPAYPVNSAGRKRPLSRDEAHDAAGVHAPDHLP